jgi:ADP-ribosylation factor 6
LVIITLPSLSKRPRLPVFILARYFLIQLIFSSVQMGNVPTKVLVLGLDGAGKTAVVQYLASKGVVNESTPPTTAYNVKDIKYKGVNLGLWDVAGKESLRSLWRHYYEGADAVVWVVDSHDQARLQESVTCLKRMVLDEPELKNPVILVLANKQDLPGALGKVQTMILFFAVAKLNLRPMLQRPLKKCLASVPGTARRARSLLTRY